MYEVHEIQLIRIHDVLFLNALDLLRHKEQYLDTFIKGLQETDNDVLRTVIQAISGVKDERLLPYYKQIAKRFSKDEDYILSNLKRVLEPFGLTVEEARK